MNQREFIYSYNDKYRPKFNTEFFKRSDNDLVNALKHVVYSCERNGAFTIKIQSFEVIDGYDDVNHVLWEYEESIINKNKNPSTEETSKKASSKKKDNQFAYINLKDSDLKVVKVTYFIQINEKKDGLVSDTVTVYIAIPKIVDGFYFRLNGNIYSAMYQIVDASTYNNSTAKNAKKQSITFKTVFMPIRVYRYNSHLTDISGSAIPATYFIANMFRKSLLLIKYLLAKMGFYECMNFLHLQDIRILNDITGIDHNKNYVFPVRDMYIVVPKIEYDSIQICQSFVYTLYSTINYMQDYKYPDVFNTDMYIKALGAEFTTKDITTIYDKGINILGSLEFIYDNMSRADLKLPEDDKEDIYRILRWMMYEFNSLRQKDNLDISTKKVRYAEYLASYYASKLAMGIYRVSDKGERADLSTLRKAIQIPPMYLINAITKCQLVNYKNCVNDLDALIALKYTYKGISGIGETSQAISSAYRSIHPSHLGRVDIDSSSNSDPGISGTICPLATLYDGHFVEYEEPSTWRELVNAVLDSYRSMESKKALYKLVTDTTGKQQSNTDILDESLQAARSLLEFPLMSVVNEEYIDGIDLFGDGYMFWLRENR